MVLKVVGLEIKNLIDDEECYRQVRQLRWPSKITCPHSESVQIIKRGKDDTEKFRQRYECHQCHNRFDDLTNTIFTGHHQPLEIWILCLYFMGLNLSNRQIAYELDLNKDDAQNMVSQLRSGIVKKTKITFSRKTCRTASSSTTFKRCARTRYVGQ